MITTCPICGKSLNEDEIFCPNCKALLFDGDTDSGPTFEKRNDKFYTKRYLKEKRNMAGEIFDC